MNEKINILNIELYQTSAKAAMQKVVQYMESDSINTVEIITMDMLLKGKDMPGWKEAVESLNLVLPGETEILEAAGVREKTLLRDTAGLVFLKMFLRYIQRNKKRVFLVAQSETELLEMESAIREHDRKLILAGRGVLPPASFPDLCSFPLRSGERGLSQSYQSCRREYRQSVLFCPPHCGWGDSF